MYQLHYFPSNANAAPHMVLEELGQQYDLALVDRQNNAQKSKDYLKINPNGRIPTLVDGELVMFEAAAIVLHLVDKHPEAGLAPRVGTPERAKFYQWMAFLTNSLQEELMIWQYPDRLTGGRTRGLAPPVAPGVDRRRPRVVHRVHGVSRKGVASDGDGGQRGAGLLHVHAVIGAGETVVIRLHLHRTVSGSECVRRGVQPLTTGRAGHGVAPT